MLAAIGHDEVHLRIIVIPRQPDEIRSSLKDSNADRAEHGAGLRDRKDRGSFSEGEMFEKLDRRSRAPI